MKLSTTIATVLLTLFVAAQADAGRGKGSGGGRSKPVVGSSRGGGHSSMGRSGGSRSGGIGSKPFRPSSGRPSSGRSGAQGHGTRGPGSSSQHGGASGLGGKRGDGGIGSRPGRNQGPGNAGPGKDGRGPFSSAGGDRGPRSQGENPRGQGEGRPENRPFSSAAEQAGFEKGQGREQAQSNFENAQTGSGTADSGSAAESGGSSDAATSSNSNSSSSASADGGSYDYDIDVDADLDVDGVPYCGVYGAYGAYGAYVAPAYGVAVALPSCAAYFGVVPAFYPAYYPACSASVTYVYEEGQPAEETTVIINNTTEGSGEPAAGEAVYPEAITSSIESLNATPGAAESMQQGTNQFQQRDYQGAAIHFAQAADLDPDNGLPLFSLAQAQFAMGDFQNAALNIRRGLDRMPEWVSSGNDLRQLYSVATDLESERAALAEHLRANPGDHAALVVLGYVDFFGGNLDGAAQSFRKLSKERPLDPIGPHFLAEIEKIQKHAATN
ncbi:MAG: hypothetical protein V2A76_12040 [Planctomycetota bacterium]